ncbi:Six-hairpin glycosidase [Penicillium odoratum]|uniref:Six-hairpin glycosidase n=1 Tax=Penicillium odoratum TaxID=1167516 RepID=UPI002547CE9F|nr:Six-hairpin glycosidase [Penicillium odoratum]KAJ5751847.1 Six-hairpin glycosidase [Penicillium odoratum]
MVLWTLSRNPGPPRSPYTILAIFLLSLWGLTNALATQPQRPLGESLSETQELLDFATDLGESDARGVDSWSLEAPAQTLQNLLDALNVMQDGYFCMWLGTWPTSIDWTAAVLSTHVSASLSSFTSYGLGADAEQPHNQSSLALENTVNRFFSQLNTFYFGENAFELRNQAYDDMLWVVLNWLENIKFQDLHTELHYTPNISSGSAWYGTQFRDSAAHRARIFYELASAGWDKTLCDGGMIWNPSLTPYKNAITNELFISASIAMYLYFPGDPIDAPFLTTQDTASGIHNPIHLKAAVDGYTWLRDSNMTGIYGLYADGFHISGWRSASNPGTRKCDVLNTMVFTYNQGVILSGLRGLWLATGSQDYLRDGHELIHKVLRATGWPRTSSTNWAGLGRGGVLEDTCDSHASCSQDGQTFKGIFFHHLTEFCRPLRPQEKQFLAETRRPVADENWEQVFRRHLNRCRAYGPWIEHNARAVLMTRDDDGKFGMWWGIPFSSILADEVVDSSTLPEGAVDYRNGNMDDGTSAVGVPRDFNDRGRGRTVETQSGGVAVLRALFQWQTSVLS